MRKFDLSFRGLICQAVAVAALAITLPAVAQSSGGPRADAAAGWWVPGSGRSILGMSLGRSNYQVPCGTGFPCDDTDNYFSLYGRQMATENWGGEIGAINAGRIDRGGGTTRAYGLNFSLVGRAGLAPKLSAVGKLGGIYGRTRTSASAGSGITTGTENGLGLSFGLGLSWDLTPQLAAVLGWDHYEFKFRDGRDGVHGASLGLQYRF